MFGGSSAGIIAVQMALRHPTIVRRVLAFEPGYFHEVPDGPRLHDLIATAMTDHLDGHPDDWVGAYGAFVSATSPGDSPGTSGFLAAPTHEWYARREEMDAEPFVRDDVAILTREQVDRAALAAAAVEILASPTVCGRRPSSTTSRPASRMSAAPCPTSSMGSTTRATSSPTG